MQIQKDKTQQHTFLATVVHFKGENVRWEQLGHVIKAHHPFNFQLFWPDGHTKQKIHRISFCNKSIKAAVFFLYVCNYNKQQQLQVKL